MRKILSVVNKSRIHSSAYRNKYFDRLLVANRGEIACRVMETAKKCGIYTIAVYSDADANAKFVKMADEALYIGSNDVTESYNNMDTILQAAKDSKADAIHPGYGFLAENEDFSERVTAEGFIFVGPPPYAIHCMGDKIVSKEIARDSGVNTIPGYDGEVETKELAVEVSNDIGYPIMLKASAGGGGKGMRICNNDEEVLEGFELCKAEAKNFANDKMLVEKFVDNPRHVEIQVLGDQHGNYVYLNERECSVQRRNQKVIEEAPCVVLDPETRKKMGEQACMLSEAVGYYSAGTVEMMVSQQEDETHFYFLEMNTRLQVEHPVTEYITGYDLVEEMFKIAAGEELTIKQEDVPINGWATECRVYAEDPLKDFAPAIGILQEYVEPFDESGHIRVDSGILPKDEISVFFDPMICKLITYGEDREASIEKMIWALDTYVIYGEKVKHNINFLRDVLENESYRAGTITTNYIQDTYPDGFQGIQLSEEDKKYMAACAGFAEFFKMNSDRNTSQKLEGTYKVPEDADLVVSWGEVEAKEGEEHLKQDPLEKFSLNIKIAEDKFIITYEDGSEIEFKSDWKNDSPIIFAEIDGKERIFQILKHNLFDMLLQFKGTRFDLRVQTKGEDVLEPIMPFHPPPDLSKMLIAEMAGQIIEVNVSEGDEVEEGDDIMIMEAMKMQNRLKAPKTGIVKCVHVVEGDVVENDQILIEFED